VPSSTRRTLPGDKDVSLHAATPVQQAIRAGLLDELQIHLVPVLLGDGRRLLEHLGDSNYGGDARIRLEPFPVVDAPGVTHLKYRVVR
jgi:dihydrofolate reductase